MKKVVVGISGGVDSSVAALLLKEKGYEVIGVTFIFTDDFDVEDAKEVCQRLGIKHYIKDYRKEFKDTVIKSFIDDYKKGLTPNPCVLCNKVVKIKYLFDIMEELSCDFIATGHYASIKNSRLYKSKNIKKDQSYFLALIQKSKLEKLLFPLNDLSKEEVRNIALKNGLVTANKRDSFDVCFIKDSFREYINKNIKGSSGAVINVENNEQIGTHSGLEKYTIGQRRGLDIGGTKERLFVVGKNVEKNILYVALGGENEYLNSDSCIIENVNFITEGKVLKCNARFRYASKEFPVKLRYLENNKILVEYAQISSVTPGQTCVFYEDDECLGGGTITEVRKDNKKLWYL